MFGLGGGPDDQSLSDGDSLNSHTLSTSGPRGSPASMIHRVDSSDIMYNVVFKPPKIVGDYVVGARLGEGAFGRVKEGIHVATLERVAIKIMKIMRLRKLNNGNGPANARKEILLLRKLRHQNVIRMQEVLYKAEKEKIYLVLEYCAGNLKEVLDSHPDANGFPLYQAHDYFGQLLEGVSYIHSQGVIHRDIKPGNLLLTNAGVVKLSDFGVADELSPYDQSSTVCTGVGTRPFMSPELVVGGSVDICGFKVDVWACGVTLWNLTTGGYPFPFEHGSAMELYSSIGKGEYTVPEHLPEALRGLLVGILTVNPAERLTVPGILEHEWMQSLPVVGEHEVPLILMPREDGHDDPDRGTTLVPYLDAMHSLDTLRTVHPTVGGTTGST